MNNLILAVFTVVIFIIIVIAVKQQNKVYKRNTEIRYFKRSYSDNVSIFAIINDNYNKPILIKKLYYLGDNNKEVAETIADEIIYSLSQYSEEELMY